jgi:hypothetical protein
MRERVRSGALAWKLVRARSMKALVLVLLAGCGDMTPPAGEARVVLGGVTDGQDATLVPGAQGGFHVWLTLRVDGLSSRHVRIYREGRRIADGKQVLRWDGTLEIGPANAGGSWQPPDPVPMFMCPTPIGLSVVDQPIELSIRLSDGAADPLAAAAVTVVPRCPDDEMEWCMRICSG